MKISGHRIRQYKFQTLSFTVAFITLIHTGAHFYNQQIWGETLAWWSISTAGAVLLILSAFHQIDKTQGKLDEQLTRSQKYSQRQTALAGLSGGFAANISEDEICNELVYHLNQIPGYEYVAVYLLDDNTGDRVLRALASHEGLPAALTIPPGEGLTDPPILDGQLHYSPDVSKAKNYIPGLGLGSEINVPIEFDDEKLGVLVAANRGVDAFGPDDFAMLSTVADQAALALQNSRLLASEQKHRSEAEILRNATVAVSSDLNLDQVLNQILVQLGEVVPFNSACIFLRQDETVQAKAARGLPDPQDALGLHFPDENELFQLVLQTGQPVILGDIKNDPRFQGWGGTYQMNSWMGVPLRVGEDIIGYLTLDHRQLDAYNPETGELALIIANQTAIAIQNARLYQAAKISAEKLVILHEASQAITSASFNPERTYTTIHEAASRLMPCEAFSIAILDEKNNEIEAVYLFDRDGRTPATRIPKDQGLSGYVIATGESLIVHDFFKSKKMENIEVKRFGSPDHIRGFIAVPMRLGNNIVGALSAQSYQPHEYSTEDQHLLEMLAAHAAIAIDNAQLFAQVQHLATTLFVRRLHQFRNDQIGYDQNTVGCRCIPEVNGQPLAIWRSVVEIGAGDGRVEINALRLHGNTVRCPAGNINTYASMPGRSVPFPPSQNLLLHARHEIHAPHASFQAVLRALVAVLVGLWLVGITAQNVRYQRRMSLLRGRETSVLSDASVIEEPDRGDQIHCQSGGTKSKRPTFLE